LLCAKGLTFSYRQPQQQVVDVSLQVAEGEILGLLGPNGAGKTTLVSLMTGQLTPSSGSITLHKEKVYLGHPDIALVPQEFAFYPRLSVAENLAYFAGVLNLPRKIQQLRSEHAIARCALAEFKSRRAGQLSGGLKRRLNFAIALLQAPKLLILDEPTANVDPHSRAFLLDTLRQLNAEGTAVIYTSHLLSEVESLADTVAVMDQGRILLQGPMSDLLNEQQHSIYVKLTPDPTASLALELNGIKQTDGWWQFYLAGHGKTLATVLTRLESAGVVIEQIRYGQRRLEEVYLSCISGAGEL